MISLPWSFLVLTILLSLSLLSLASSKSLSWLICSSIQFIVRKSNRSQIKVNTALDTWCNYILLTSLINFNLYFITTISLKWRNVQVAIACIFSLGKCNNYYTFFISIHKSTGTLYLMWPQTTSTCNILIGYNSSVLVVNPYQMMISMYVWYKHTFKL